MVVTHSYNHEGVNHPLLEAEYDTAFKAFKTDRKRAVIGDPGKCIEAIGLRRLPNVAFAHIGSGKEAYVGFYDSASSTGITVRRFIIPVAAQKVRDAFDVKGSPNSQVLMLKAPSNGQTKSHLAMLGRRRREEVKNGASVKPRGQQKNRRTERLGVAHRPRAKVVKGEVSLAT